MKKVFLLAGMLLLLCNLYSQQHILLQFTSQQKVPAATLSPVTGRYVFETTDTGLKNLLNSSEVITFTKEYPSAHLVNHPNAAILDRVYKIETVSSKTIQLYEDLKNLATTSYTSDIYLLAPSEPLFEPDDYSLVSFQFCGNVSSGFQNNLIHAPEAWDFTKGNPSIRIGMTDVNFRRTHEEIAGKVDYDNADPFDPAMAEILGRDHGTQTATLASGNTNNGKGIASIGFNSRLDIYNNSFNDILNAAINGARVINCSWYDPNCQFVVSHQQMIDMIHDVYKPVIVAAAGNNASQCGSIEAILFPAGYNHVLDISGIGHFVDPAPSVTCGWGYKDLHIMNYFETTLRSHHHNADVDLCAPSLGLYVPTAVTDVSYLQYGFGTSFATPMVSGTAALMFSVNPALLPEDVEAILKCTSRDLYELPLNIPFLNKLGTGRLDASKAVRLAATWVPGSAPSVQPAPTDIRWFEVFSDGTNTTEVETTCTAGPPPAGMTNVGYRLEVVAANPNQTFKWLTMYYHPGTCVNYSTTCIMNNIKYGNSVFLQRGVDFPYVNEPGGNFKICVRVDDCIPSIYYSEDRSVSCIREAASHSCPSDVTITGNYSTALQESFTWIKSSGQTTSSPSVNVKLDAHPFQGYVELKPASNADYFVATPAISGSFTAVASNGCSAASGGRYANNVKKGVLEEISEIRVYPNPTGGLFTVEHSLNVKWISVTNVQGVVLKRIDQPKSASTNIDISYLPAGMYFVSIDGGKGIKVVKN